MNVFGNLNVTGNINQINSDQINVLDKNIVLASNNNNDSYINGAGLILKSSSDKKFTWDSSTGWTSTEKITVATDKTSQLGGNVTVKGEIDTIDASTLELGKSTATAVAIGASNIISTVKVKFSSKWNNNIKKDNVSIDDTKTLAVGTGATSLGGSLTVTGITTLNNNVTIADSKTLAVGTGATSLEGL